MQALSDLKQSFPHKNHCEHYWKLASRLWLGLFTLTYFFFLYIHSPLLLENKICCDCCFPLQIKPQTTIQLYILWDSSSNACNRHTRGCPFSKYFQILFIFAQIFKYFVLFCPLFTLLWKNPVHSLSF